MTERWREIPGFDGHYEVSDQGRVRSLDRENAQGAKIKGKVLKPYPSQGHPLVILCLEGKHYARNVSTLALEAFEGEAPEGMVAKHIDGDNSNNRLINLEWRVQVGEDASNVTLTEIEAKEILALRQQGLTIKQIAKRFDISDAHVCRIGNGTRWRHLMETAA